MAVQIIPTLNVNSREEYIRNLKAIEGVVDLAQIDIADGKFSEWKNWHDPEVIAGIETNMNYELQVMTQDPFEEMKLWSEVKNIKRVIAHVESHCDQKKCDPSELMYAIPAMFPYDIEIGLGINPQTSIGFLNLLETKPTHVLLLGVSPGRSGQKFDKSVLKKITQLRKKHPSIKIEIDGGVTKKNIRALVKAGADIICSGSAIFNDQAAPKENYIELKNLADSVADSNNS